MSSDTQQGCGECGMKPDLYYMRGDRKMCTTCFDAHREAAKILDTREHAHVPTWRERIARIESLLGIDWSQPDGERASSGETCPKCESRGPLHNPLPDLTMLSNPPMFHAKCSACGHIFTSLTNHGAKP